MPPLRGGGGRGSSRRGLGAWPGAKAAPSANVSCCSRRPSCSESPPWWPFTRSRPVSRRESELRPMRCSARICKSPPAIPSRPMRWRGCGRTPKESGARRVFLPCFPSPGPMPPGWSRCAGWSRIIPSMGSWKPIPRRPGSGCIQREASSLNPLCSTSSGSESGTGSNSGTLSCPSWVHLERAAPAAVGSPVFLRRFLSLTARWIEPGSWVPTVWFFICCTRSFPGRIPEHFQPGRLPGTLWRASFANSFPKAAGSLRRRRVGGIRSETHWSSWRSSWDCWPWSPWCWGPSAWRLPSTRMSVGALSPSPSCAVWDARPPRLSLFISLRLWCSSPEGL